MPAEESIQVGFMLILPLKLCLSALEIEFVMT